MECNRDEAEKCIDIAYKYLLVGNEQLARKMCHKAERLYPSKRIKELRRTIDNQAEQAKHVERVQICKNLYEILNVTKTSTNQEIRKAFKKLALVLHPDKNHAPGAHEAFLKAQNAMNILTDPEKRRAYDFDEEWKANKSSSQPTRYHQDNVNTKQPKQQWARNEQATQWNGPLSFNEYGYEYYYQCLQQMYHPQNYSVPSYWYCHQNYYSSHGLYNNWYC